MAEYVGPSQFQFTEKQVKIINDILALLPEELKKSTIDPDVIKNTFYVTPIEYMNDHDPSEAIRSSDILPTLSKHFKIIEKNDYGGTILHMLLQDIMGNYDISNSYHKSILSLIVYLEDTLISEKVLNSDFTFVISQKS